MPTLTPFATPTAAAARPLSASAPAAERSEKRGAPDDGGLSFGDFLDIINPLQHIPIVGMIYREITGDVIGPAAKMIGGLLFGGIPGFVASLADSVVERVTGSDAGEHLIALLRSGENDTLPDTGTLIARSADSDDGIAEERGEIAAFQDRARARGAKDSEADIAALAGDDADNVFTDDDDADLRFAPSATAAATAPRNTTGNDIKRQAALYQARINTQPLPLRTRVPMQGVPGGAFAGLPSPQTLAANPNLITAARSAADLRKGGSAAAALSAADLKKGGSAAAALSAADLKKGGSAAAARHAERRASHDATKTEAAGLSSGAWVRLMDAARGDRPSGPSGLATATIARAMARYGAADGLTGAGVAAAPRR